MTSVQHKLSSSVGDGFGFFAMTGVGHTLSPGFWGGVLRATPATATIAVSPLTVPDDGTALVFIVTLSPPPAVATPVSIASAVIAGGAMTGVTNNCLAPVIVSPLGVGTCTISATNTVAIDGPVTATVTLAGGAGWAVGVPSVAVGTITDDDLAIGITVQNPSVTDGADAVFILTCRGAATATVNYSFSGNYTPLPPNSGPVVITCGTPLLVTIPTVDDPNLNVRTLTLNMADPTPFIFISGIGSATVLVLDRNYLAQAIPTASSLGMLLLGLLVAVAASRGLRRKFLLKR